MGIGISTVAGVVYVGVWEIYSSFDNHQYIDSYTNSMIESIGASEKSPEEKAQSIADIKAVGEKYRNPVYRLPMTFLEVFPPGLLVSLVSALILRNHRTGH